MNISLLIAFFLFQVPEYEVTFYDSKSGLPNNIVYDIHQDNDGFIWLATENGLSRFDAYDFKVFYHSPLDTSSLSSNVVRSIHESSDGELWFGTRQGINLFDRKGETFTRFSIPDSFNIKSNDIHVLKPDSNNRLWYIAQSRLIYFDLAKKVYGEVRLPLLLYNFVIDVDDILWLSGYDGGIYKYSIDEGELNQISKSNEDATYSFFLGDDGKTVLYNFSNTGEIPINGWQQLPLLQDGINVERFFQDSKERKWFGTEQGLYLQEAYKEPQKFDLQGQSLSILTNIKAIFEDKAGGMWIGTVNGLYHLDPQKKKFNKLNIEGSERTVMAIEEAAGSWWVNNFSQKLSQYRTNSANEAVKFADITLPNGVNQIWDIQEIHSNELWLATERGLYKLTVNTLNFSKINLPNTDKKSEVVFSITKSDNSTYWLGGYGAIFQINGDTKEVTQKIEILKEYEGALTQDIIILDEGLLIATETHGMFYYSEVSGLSKKWNNFEIGKQINQTSIWDIFRSADKTIWVGGNNGLFRIKNSEDFAQPKKIDIGENRIVFSITEDNNGILWLGTDKGLIQFNPEINETRLYSVQDKTVNSEFNRRSIFTSQNGQVVAGGMGGVVYFKPDEIELNQNKPEVWITDFRVITPDSVVSYSTHMTSELTLNWQRNTLEIDFTALNYTNSVQNQYKYQLVGYDPDWVMPQNSRQARYVRLPAGEYVFNVIASNNDGIWNEVGDSINIIVQPPFWQTNWFRVLILLAVIFIAWSLYRFRVRQLLEVERVRLRIAGDLHDEIGSGLSGIALTGDLLRNHAKTGNAKPEMIEKITTNARSLASSLDSIVWLIDSGKETLGDLVMKTKRMSKEMLHGIQIEFSEELSEKDFSIELNTDTKRHLFLLIKESLNNIAKHAQAKKVGISFKKEDSLLNVQISDDGKGFDHSEIEKGNGLENMQNRADQLGADYRLNTGDNGTEIIIKKKLP